MAEIDMKEGFLCPICKIDLKTMTKLHSHFHEEHSEDIDIKKIFKGVMGQARKMIKQNNEGDDSFKSTNRKDLHNLEIYKTYQEIGVTRSHFEKFKEIRNRRLEGFSAETNKLIIRLDKLLLNLPSDSNRRKLHEQTIVPWINGEDVSRCPECTKSFHLVRWQHHCRLCGGIMCRDCSCFLPIAKAENILSHTVQENHITKETNYQDAFRICQYCMNLLESRELMKASRNCNPFITQLYEQLRTYIKDLDKDANMYQKMSLSLNEGKSTYNLFDAQELWEKIMKLSEKIRLISTKIASLGVNNNSNEVSNKELQLQRAVSSGANGYIQSKILSLPALPSEEIYQKLQENRRQKIQQEIKEQKSEEMTDALLSSQIKTEYVHSKPTLSKFQKNIPVDEGWIPDAGSCVYHNDDPILEQMNNIRNYIKQAREAYKFDEVASLEKNLRELQEEYYRQQTIK
ncbi:hypothetical protein PGB90_005241 [Kerria lacca]